MVTLQRVNVTDPDVAAPRRLQPAEADALLGAAILTDEGRQNPYDVSPHPGTAGALSVGPWIDHRGRLRGVPRGSAQPGVGSAGARHGAVARIEWA